jgi:membrane-associated protein
MVIKLIIDFVLNIDKYIDLIVYRFGIFTYFILFFIIFFETGLVITPFLPGDSLIFVAGAFAAKGVLNVFLLYVFFCLAAILGDSINYLIGNYLGEKIFLKHKLIKEENLNKTKNFFNKYGGKTIVLARFVPIIRTFAPFVAGIGKMNYTRFVFYNILGGIIWVSLFLFAGYFFGKIPFVERNLTIIIFIIIGISVVPIIYEYIKHRIKNNYCYDS